MAGHLLAKGHSTLRRLTSTPTGLQLAGENGIATHPSLAALAKAADVFILVVATDEQVDRRRAMSCRDRQRTARTIVVAATISPDDDAGTRTATARLRGKRLVDAPVVYGASGAREGTLLSLCGGDRSRHRAGAPSADGYSRDVLRVGPVGAGQVAKACNNLLHWVHCVANFETLLIAKRYGIDAQRMREVLLECPGHNGTLRRWDNTRFTWQEKDMDLTLDLAQKAGLVLPLAGQVDQIIKTLTAADVKALLYGEEASYLGRKVAAMASDEGGLQ